MSWVCTNCSNSNEEASTSCAVCGYDRPTEIPVHEHERVPEAVEGKIVFSDFAVITESVKGTFRSIGRAGRKIKNAIKELAARKSSEKVRAPKERSPREKRERAETPRRERTPRVRNGFAKPWPEHNIRFDIDAIKTKGYVRSEQTELNSVKGYTFYKEDGTGRFIRADMLVVLGMAKNI